MRTREEIEAEAHSHPPSSTVELHALLRLNLEAELDTRDLMAAFVEFLGVHRENGIERIKKLLDYPGRE